MGEAADGACEVGRVTVAGVDLEEVRYGSGSPLVYLHGEDGLLFSADVLAALGSHFSVRAPSHPGWGGSDRRPHLRTVEDLAYVYLDYLEATLDGPAVLVGASFGAWLAASVATKSTALVSSLVLVSPVGIKVGDRETRDFVDVYAAAKDHVHLANYGEGPRPDLLALAPEDFGYLARAQEAMARYGFKPYLHDPALVHRLHRVDVPTLVLWGTDDRFTRDPGGYAETFAGAIGGNARTEGLPGGHRLEEQLPAVVAEAVAGFAAGDGDGDAAADADAGGGAGERAVAGAAR